MYFNLVGIVIQSLILKYVLENETDNCECALTWHHKFIKLFNPILIICLFIGILFNKEILKLKKNNLFQIFNLLLGGVNIMYIITLVIYFFKLQNESKCECSKDWKRHILSYPLVVLTILYLVALFSILYK